MKEMKKDWIEGVFIDKTRLQRETWMDFSREEMVTLCIIVRSIESMNFNFFFFTKAGRPNP